MLWVSRLFFLISTDGVLNGDNTREMCMNFTFVEDKKVAMLKEIVDATGAVIVLSSTWRMCFDPEDRLHMLAQKLTEKFDEFGLKIFDMTPQISTYRGKEIDAWLKDHPECEKFIILDDYNDMQPHGARLIQTSGRSGMTDKNVCRAIAMLNE